MSEPTADLPATSRAQTAPHGRSWPVTANALLLLLGTAGFLGMAVAILSPLGLRWPTLPTLWREHQAAVVLGFSFGLMAMLALAAAIGFLRAAPGAWLLAVLVQGLNLGLALLLYFGDRPPYVYVMMVYGVVMVLYLHQADVQASFRPEEPLNETGTVR